MVDAVDAVPIQRGRYASACSVRPLTQG